MTWWNRIVSMSRKQDDMLSYAKRRADQLAARHLEPYAVRRVSPECYVILAVAELGKGESVYRTDRRD